MFFKSKDKKIVEIGKFLQELGAGTYEPVKNTEQKLDVICELAKQLFPGASITLKKNEPYKSMGYVSVEAETIHCAKPEVFLAMSALASNIDFCPKSNGNVQIDFTVHGIARKVGK